MDEIIANLKQIRDEIEARDDATAPDSYRELIDDAHFSIEKCITALKRVIPMRGVGDG